MCGPSVGAAPPFAVRLRYHDINLRRPPRDRNGAEREMEAFDHVATNDDTNRQVGRLNYFPLCRAVQVAFKTGVSRGKEGPLAHWGKLVCQGGLYSRMIQTGSYESSLWF